MVLSQSAYRCCWQNAWETKEGGSALAPAFRSFRPRYLGSTIVEPRWGRRDWPSMCGEGRCFSLGCQKEISWDKNWEQDVTLKGRPPVVFRLGKLLKGSIPSSKALSHVVSPLQYAPQITSKPSRLNHIPKVSYVNMLNWGPSQREYMREHKFKLKHLSIWDFHKTNNLCWLNQKAQWILSFWTCFNLCSQLYNS